MRKEWGTGHQRTISSQCQALVFHPGQSSSEQSTEMFHRREETIPGSDLQVMLTVGETAFFCHNGLVAYWGSWLRNWNPVRKMNGQMVHTALYYLYTGNDPCFPMFKVKNKENEEDKRHSHPWKERKKGDQASHSSRNKWNQTWICTLVQINKNRLKKKGVGGAVCDFGAVLLQEQNLTPSLLYKGIFTLCASKWKAVPWFVLSFREERATQRGKTQKQDSQHRGPSSQRVMGRNRDVALGIKQALPSYGGRRKVSCRTDYFLSSSPGRNVGIFPFCFSRVFRRINVKKEIEHHLGIVFSFKGTGTTVNI